MPTPADSPARLATVRGMGKAAFLLLALVLAIPSARADTLPSRNPGVVLPRLAKFSDGDGYGTIREILGRPDVDLGGAFSICVYRLDDSTSIYVKASPSRNRIYGISRSAPGGLAQKLYEPLREDRTGPPPASARF